MNDLIATKTDFLEEEYLEFVMNVVGTKNEVAK
jgi:hypothetical protein